MDTAVVDIDDFSIQLRHETDVRQFGATGVCLGFMNRDSSAVKVAAHSSMDRVSVNSCWVPAETDMARPLANSYSEDRCRQSTEKLQSLNDDILSMEGTVERHASDIIEVQQICSVPPVNKQSTFNNDEFAALLEDVRVLRRSAIDSGQQTQELEQLKKSHMVLRGELDVVRSHVELLAKRYTTNVQDTLPDTMGQKSSALSSNPSSRYSRWPLPVLKGSDKRSDPSTRRTSNTTFDDATTALSFPYSFPRLATTLFDFKTEATYKLNSSIWDASIFIGAPNLSIGVTFALVLCLIFNVLLVTLFIAVIGAMVATAEQSYDKSTVDEFTFWRATIAHDLSLRNPITGESLASGVCNKRLSTPFSNSNILALNDLDAYLIGFGGSWCAGKMMCSLAVLVWILTLVGEVRDIFGIMVVCNGLTRTTRQSIVESSDGGVRLIGIGTYRKALMLLMCLIRMGVVAMLAWYGVQLLVFEISLADLLLDAVSLGFILNVDELVFISLAPKIVRCLILRMVPMPLPRFTPIRELIVLASLVLLPFVLVFIFILEPYVGVLQDSRNALCGGVENSWNFVVVVDAIGIPWAAPTSTSTMPVSSYSQHAILQAKMLGFPQIQLQPQQRSNLGSFMHASSGDALESFLRTIKAFHQPKDWTVVDATKFDIVEGWNELDVLGPDNVDFGNVHGSVYNHYLHYLLGAPATANMTCDQVPVSRCNKYGSTVDAVVIRQLCPGRCGCDEPSRGTVGSFSGVSLKSGFSGCGLLNYRRKKFQTELATMLCRNTVSHNIFAQWAMGLGDARLGQTETLLKDISITAFDTGGCPAVAKLDLGYEKFARICEESSLPAICPSACGCNSSLPFNFDHSRVTSYCPHACQTGNILCFTTNGGHTGNLSARNGPFAGYACVFPFVYKGLTYTTCTSVDWPVPWCAVAVQRQDQISIYWGDCSYDCLRRPEFSTVVD